VRSEEEMIARVESGELPVREYLAAFVKEIPEFSAGRAYRGKRNGRDAEESGGRRRGGTIDRIRRA